MWGSDKPQKNEAVDLVTEGNCQFSVELYEALQASGQTRRNVVFSPFCLSATAVIAKLGSRGDAKAEIERGFHFPKDDAILSSGFRQIFAILMNEKFQQQNELTFASKLYLQSGSFKVKQTFVKSLTQVNGDMLPSSLTWEQLNFTEDPAGSMAAVNRWIEQVTNGKVKDINRPSYLANLQTLSLVLVSVLYFKGIWKHEFSSKDTKEAPFYLGLRGTAVVPMMFQKFNFPYVWIGEMDAHVLVLPFKGERLFLRLFIPSKRGHDGLSKIETKLKKKSFLLNFSLTTNSIIKLYLPKFSVETNLDLVQPLKMMGVKKMFSEELADFSGICDHPEKSAAPFVSKIIQKVVIEATEGGTHETSAKPGVSSVRPVPKQVVKAKTITVRADRPFLFQVIHQPTDLILITGCYHGPSDPANLNVGVERGCDSGGCEECKRGRLACSLM